jgi:lipoprotein-anchoring transpeptidase ErfK/SrfK
MADLRTVIDISEQRMYVVQDRQITRAWRVSTAGEPGCRTPVGRYRPLRLKRTWYSSRYDGAPMPYSIFFLNGYAIHGTTEVKKLGRPASHGCVRLARQNARSLFNLVRAYGMKNTWIIVRQ